MAEGWARMFYVGCKVLMFFYDSFSLARGCLHLPTGTAQDTSQEHQKEVSLARYKAGSSRGLPRVWGAVTKREEAGTGPELGQESFLSS